MEKTLSESVDTSAEGNERITNLPGDLQFVHLNLETGVQ